MSRPALGDALPISGGPKWIYSDSYVINAKAPDQASERVMEVPCFRRFLKTGSSYKGPSRDAHRPRVHADGGQRRSQASAGGHELYSDVVPETAPRSGQKVL
jgi:hypothetical protein